MRQSINVKPLIVKSLSPFFVNIKVNTPLHLAYIHYISIKDNSLTHAHLQDALMPDRN